MTNAAGPSVAVAIVTWNTSSAALAAAEAFAGSAGVRPEVTVIDNASDESERDLLRNAGDSVRVRLEERNLGYAAAANLALSDARTEAVCVTVRTKTRVSWHARRVPATLQAAAPGALPSALAAR